VHPRIGGRRDRARRCTGGRPPCPAVPRNECEQAEKGGGAVATRQLRGVQRGIGEAREGVHRRCVQRRRRDVLLSRKSGSPGDTDPETGSSRWSENPALRELFVIESGARSRSRTLCVLSARESRRCLTQQRMTRVPDRIRAGNRCSGRHHEGTETMPFQEHPTKYLGAAVRWLERPGEPDGSGLRSAMRSAPEARARSIS
jgi:hypothetical protein